MKADFNNNNTERMSWLTLMNRNGYIITALVLTFLIMVLVISAVRQPLNWWEFVLGFLPLFGGLFFIMFIGFYQYWKGFNKSYGWRIYTIMRGNHYSSLLRLPWFFRVKQRRCFMFAPECALATENHINKLYRIGFGFMPFRYLGQWKPAHQKNSIGFGWRGNMLGVEIYTYTYIDGVRYTEFIGVVPPATPFYFDLDNVNGRVLYSVVPYLGDVSKAQSLRSEHVWCKKPYGYKLGFYYGGKVVADRNYQVWEKL